MAGEQQRVVEVLTEGWLVDEGERSRLSTVSLRVRVGEEGDELGGAVKGLGVAQNGAVGARGGRGRKLLENGGV